MHHLRPRPPEDPDRWRSAVIHRGCVRSDGAGHDVAGHRCVDPVLGDLAEALIADALALSIRTIVDVVPHHVSDQHPEFQQALASPPGSPERARASGHCTCSPPRQPDLDREHPQVPAELEDVLRSWSERGIAGTRIDSAAPLVKDAALPEVPALAGPGGHPHVDRDEPHDVHRGWRAVADSCARTRMPLDGRLLPPDTCAWVALPPPDRPHP